MAGAGTGAEQGPPGAEATEAATEAAAEAAALMARVAALEGQEAAVAEERVEVANAANLAAKHAQLPLLLMERETMAVPERQLPLQRLEWRDWAGLPQDLLVKVAGTLVAQSEAGQAAQLEEDGHTEEMIQEVMEERKRDGTCPLFVFARVCKEWRKAQLKVGGPLRTRVVSDVLLPGRVALVKWALAEGCSRELNPHYSLANAAGGHGHLELVQWLCGEQGFQMDPLVMGCAAMGGNLELVQWLRGEGCPWDATTCQHAAFGGHVEVLRWARENGCPWYASTRDQAAEELGYTDDLGNLVDDYGDSIQ